MSYNANEFGPPPSSGGIVGLDRSHLTAPAAPPAGPRNVMSISELPIEGRGGTLTAPIQTRVSNRLTKEEAERAVGYNPDQFAVHPNPMLPVQAPALAPVANDPYALQNRDYPGAGTSAVRTRQLDPYTTPNYVPPAPARLGRSAPQAVLDAEEADFRATKSKRTKWEKWMDGITMPVLVAVLFFVANLPAVNGFLYKNFGFLRLHGEDGNLNMSGLFFRAGLFGWAYHLVTELVAAAGEI